MESLKQIVMLCMFFNVYLCGADKEHKHSSPRRHQPHNKSQGHFKFINGSFFDFMNKNGVNNNAVQKSSPKSKDESKKASHTIPNTPVDDLGFVNNAFDSMVVERGSRGSGELYSMQYSSQQPGAAQQPGMIMDRKDSQTDLKAREQAFQQYMTQTSALIKDLNDQKDDRGEYLVANLLIKNLPQTTLCVMLPVLVKAALTTNKQIRQLEGPEHRAVAMAYWWAGQAATAHDEDGQKKLRRIAKKFSKKKYAMPNLKHKLERAYFVKPNKLKILREFAKQQGNRVYQNERFYPQQPQDKVFDV